MLWTDAAVITTVLPTKNGMTKASVMAITVPPSEFNASFRLTHLFGS